MDPDAVRDFYHRYLQRCNERRFDELGEFVSADVRTNGAAQGLEQYAAGLRAMVAPFPAYAWKVRHLLVDGDWLSAHFTDTAAPASGPSIETQEFVVYRLADGKIAEVWGVWVPAAASVLSRPNPV